MNFDEIYSNTYDKVLKYVTIKCDNINNIFDIMQNVYLKLFNILEKRNYQIDNMDAFLMKLAKNELYKYYSLKNKIKVMINLDIDNESSFDIIENIEDKKINVEEEAINKFMLDEIYKEIKKLDALTSKIITLYYLQEIKLADIAEALGINESTVKSKLYRGLEKIKNNMERVDKNE